jgi:nucleolar GTP-binding protein
MFRLPHISTADELIDKSFRQAAKSAKIEKGKGKRHSKQDRYLNAELARVKITGSIIAGDLEALVDGFPSFDQLSKFHQQLFQTKVDIDQYRKSLARIQGIAKQTNNLKAQYIPRMKKTRDPELSKQYLGRAASMVGKIKKELNWLIEVKGILRSFPVIKEDPTIVIAGYPNVGKSTFLKTLTGSQVKTASYPFTTQKILIGYRKKRYVEYQLVDTPGLLDRPLKDRNPVELQAVTAIKHLAHLTLFIYDPTQDEKPQLNLLEEIKEEIDTPILTAVNLKPQAKDKQMPLENPVTFNALDEKECIQLFNKCTEEIRDIL